MHDLISSSSPYVVKQWLITALPCAKFEGRTAAPPPFPFNEAKSISCPKRQESTFLISAQKVKSRRQTPNLRAGRIAPDARSSVGAPRLILAGALLLLISPSCSGRQSPIMPFKNAYSGFTLSGATRKKEDAIPRVAVDDISPEDFFKK